jgi:hypothetical protein
MRCGSVEGRVAVDEARAGYIDQEAGDEESLAELGFGGGAGDEATLRVAATAARARRATAARGARSLARCTSPSNVPNDANIRTRSLYRPLISGR